MAFRFCDKKGRVLKVNHNIERKGKHKLDTPKNYFSVRYIKISYLMNFRIWKLRKYYEKEYGGFRYDYFIFGGIKPLRLQRLIERKNKLVKKQTCLKLHNTSLGIVMLRIKYIKEFLLMRYLVQWGIVVYL